MVRICDLQRVGVVAAVAAALVLSACGDDSSSEESGGGEASGGGTTIELTMAGNDGCDPASLSAAAGDVVFEVTNEGGDNAEFEILSSEPEVLIEEFLDEGESGTYTVSLGAGQYQVICGAPSDPRADLVITGEGGGDTAAPLAVDEEALNAATDEYAAFVLAQTGILAENTKEFTDAVRAGDLETARELYADVRIPWEQIEPVAELFPDADGFIDARADDYPEAEADPDFTGFHALEYGLFADGDVDMPALADRLDADIQDLIGQVEVLVIQPQVMTNGAAALIEEAAQTKITGEEERYSLTDLVTFQANIDGARTVFALVNPLLITVDEALAQDIEAQFTEVQALLDDYRVEGGFAPYSDVSEADRDAFKTSMAELSELLSQVTGSLGLQVTE